MSVSEWVHKMTSVAESGDDLMALGEELGKDATLSEEAYQEVVEKISKRLFASEIATILDSAVEHRPCPPADFWRTLILEARDPELGASLVEVLLPWVDVTALVCDILKDAAANQSWQQRAGSMAWYAACGGSIVVSTGEQFATIESMDGPRLKRAIEEVLPNFRQRHDRDALTRALKCLSKA